jgi:hypothetical protein
MVDAPPEGQVLTAPELRTGAAADILSKNMAHSIEARFFLCKAILF